MTKFLRSSGIALLAAASTVVAIAIGGNAVAQGAPEGTTPAAATAAPVAAKSVYDFTVQDIDGKNVKLSKYKGKVLLIVNTASLCGNTPQYASLEKMYKTYKGKGLRILAFPSNDFNQQEPGTNKEIHTFCTSKYATTFDLFSKIDVKGDNKAPLYSYLTSKETDPKFGGDIEWNFAKFLIGRDGTILDRIPAGKDPLTADVVASVEGALKQG